MKKLLSLLLVGLFTGISFASAGFVSDSELINFSLKDGHGQVCDFWYDDMIGDYEDVYYGVYYNGNSIISLHNPNNDPLSFPYLPSEKMYPYGEVYLVSWDNLDCSQFTVVGSSSPISWVDTPDTPSEDSSDTPLLGGVGQDFANGITSGVGSLTSGISNVLPTLILYMLPLLLVLLFLKYIRSYLKHALVGNKPRGDDIANCDLYLDNNGQLVHDYKVNGHEYVYIDDFGYVDKLDLPKYVDENLEFNKDEYINDSMGKNKFTYDRDHYDDYNWNYWSSPNGREMRDVYYDGVIYTQYKDDYGYWRNSGETSGYDDIKDKHDENPLASYKYGRF